MCCFVGYYFMYNGILEDERGSQLDASACQGLTSKDGHERKSLESFGLHGFDVDKSFI